MGAAPRIAGGWLDGLVHGLLPLLRFALLAGLAMGGSRLLLALSYGERVTAGAGLAEVLARGLRFDAVVIGVVCGVVLLGEWLAPSAVLRSAAWRRLVAAWLGGWLMLIAWNEVATPDFMAEFGVRPNHLYLEYLDAPREVFATVWQDHRGALLGGIALVGMIAAGAGRAFAVRRPAPPALPVRVLALAPLVALAVLGARGSAGHRPLNIGYAATSADALVNDLALNSTYSAFHALVQLARERRALHAYSALPRDEVVHLVRAAMQVPDAAFDDPADPLLHRVVPTGRPGSRPNLVILVEESLGAHYFPSLGGEPVVQGLERWRGRSLWFDQMYATGTRSARGLEAIVTGFMPTRASSVLGMPRAQHGFFTLAAALRTQGYRTGFIYGGDASFDNMRGFFLANGFDRVTDWDDLRGNARFATTWGVSDEDLYDHVQRDIAASHRDGRPFFTLVFSTSNHPPYEFPAGRITPYDQPAASPANAARYADYAVSRFLEQARGADYWRDTLFVVVADHESRTVGRGLVPVMSFHIPAFIAGGPVHPRVVGRIASQADLAPTLLSMMGVAAPVPATGVDQSRGDLAGPGHALMQFHDNAAYREGDDVVILIPGQAPRHFALHGLELAPAPRDTGLERRALALTQWPVTAYNDGFYRGG